MAISQGLIQSLIELWSRRSEPEDSDISHALSMARSVGSDETAPAFLKGFTWNLTTSLHETTGREMPESEDLSRCHAAAESIAQSCAVLLHDIASEVVKSDDLVLVLGVAAASRSLFGRWDLLPAQGALLICLVPPELESTHIDALPIESGVIWGSAGTKLEMLDRHSTTVQMNNITVRVPNAELIAGRTTGRMTDSADLEKFLFSAAAFQSTKSGTWKHSRKIAKRLGHADTPRQAVFKHGMEDWLGVENPPLTKVRIKLTNLFRR